MALSALFVARGYTTVIVGRWNRADEIRGAARPTPNRAATDSANPNGTMAEQIARSSYHSTLF
jgi:hypothetical protein